MNRIFSLIATVMTLGALHAGAQAIDSFPRTTTIGPTDLLLTQTNSAGAAGQKFTRSITWSNVLEALQDFSNWPTNGSGSGDVTTAQFLYVSNQVQVASNALRTDLTTVQGIANAAQGGTAALSNLVASITNTVFVNISSNLPGVLSNLTSNTRLRLAGGTYAVTPSKVLSNGIGTLNLFGKTNIIIESEEGAIIDGSSALGELLYATNVNGLVIRGLTFQGMVVTNYTLVSAIGHVHGTLGLYDVQNVLIENCRFIDGHDHGIYDLGSQPNWNNTSTNNIRILNNYFTNFGSKRTNEAVVIDGTAIVPTAGWWIQGNEFYANLRDIEPYIEGDATSNLGYGVMIVGNRFRNTIENCILPAGSTNSQFTTIAGNYFERDVGFTRRGSNIISSASFIYWNGSHGWRIVDNDFRGQTYAAVWALGGVSDGIIAGNRMHDLTNSLATGGLGIQLETVYNFTVADNDIRRGEAQSLYLYGARDSEIARNTIVDPAGEVGIQIATFSSNVASNLWIRDNVIQGATNAIWDQDLSGSENLFFTGNRIEGYTGNAYNLGTTTASEVNIRTFDTHGGTNQLATLGNLNVSSNALATRLTNIEGTTNLVQARQGGNAVLTNLTGVAASTVTNENSSALQINTGTLMLTPGVLSNVVQSGFGAPYIAIGTNLGTLVNATNLMLRGLVASNDATGIMSIHAPASSGSASISTNGNQFGASVPITIKDGAMVTNLNVTGTLTTGNGSTSNALISLSSFQGDAFALTRATNSPSSTGTTNDFQISQSAKLGDTLTLLANTAGFPVWTNGNIVLTVTDTNQAGINVDFSLPYTHYIVTTSRTNFDVAWSNTWNARVGRTIYVEFPTNLVTTSVQVTNKDAQTVRWNFGITTNGAPSIVKTNIRHLSIAITTPSTNHTVIDAANY